MKVPFSKNAAQMDIRMAQKCLKGQTLSVSNDQQNEYCVGHFICTSRKVSVFGCVYYTRTVNAPIFCKHYPVKINCV